MANPVNTQTILTQKTKPVQTYGKLEPQYAEAYNAWKQNPNKQTINQLLRSLDPIISRHIGSLPGSNAAVMRNKAKLIIIKSMDRYDPNSTGLNTFLSQQLMGLRRQHRNQNPLNIIKTPEHRELAFNRIREARVELSNKLDREPSNEEIADYLKMPVNHVVAYQTKVTARTEGGTIKSTESDDGTDTSNPSVVKPMSSKARMDYVYGELDDQDKIIFTRSPEFSNHFKTESWTPSEMSKNLNRSESFISNRKKIIQQKLEEADKVF